LVGEGEVFVISMTEKRCLNAVSASVLPRKNCWNGIPAHSITKIHLERSVSNTECFTVLNIMVAVLTAIKGGLWSSGFWHLVTLMVVAF
jgi:hypothetical protein